MELYWNKKHYQHYQEEQHQNMMVVFIVWTVFIRLEQKTNLSHIKKSVKIKVNQYHKSHEKPFVVCPDVEYLI